MFKQIVKNKAIAVGATESWNLNAKTVNALIMQIDIPADATSTKALYLTVQSGKKTCISRVPVMAFQLLADLGGFNVSSLNSFVEIDLGNITLEEQEELQIFLDNGSAEILTVDIIAEINESYVPSDKRYSVRSDKNFVAEKCEALFLIGQALDESYATIEMTTSDENTSFPVSVYSTITNARHNIGDAVNLLVAVIKEEGSLDNIAINTDLLLSASVYFLVVQSLDSTETQVKNIAKVAKIHEARVQARSGSVRRANALRGMTS